MFSSLLNLFRNLLAPVPSGMRNTNDKLLPPRERSPNNFGAETHYGDIYIPHSKSHRIIELNGGNYFVGPKTKVVLGGEGVKELWANGTRQEVIPVVLLSITPYSSADSILETIHGFQASDDVYSHQFLSDIVIVQGDVSPKTKDILHSLAVKGRLAKWSPSHIVGLGPSNAPGIPQGPYFLTSDNCLAQAWRVYPDYQDAFTTTFVPSEDNASGFEPLDGVSLEGLWRTIAVPSRLYSTVSQDKPLAGRRISVKDNFRISGLKTTHSNRAFVDTYGPDTITAEYIQFLMRLGAVIVGKTKMCAFASSEEATDQWIDFHAPFNPRGDGYQSPSGSTTGGASALASYPWLDFSIGTDTTGSIRWPAAWNGLFGLRTSWGIASLTGVYPSCFAMDTIGLLARGIDDMKSLATMTLSPSAPERTKTVPNWTSSPPKILYPTDFFPHSNPDQQRLVESFVDDLESLLSTQKIEFSIAERWKECPPPEAEGKGIKEYINKTAYYPFYYDGYNEFQQFREDYKKKYGKPVYVGPYMRWKWDRGMEVTLEQKEQALKELEVYQHWFYENVMAADGDGISNAILILPCGSGEPKYRDVPNGPPGVVPPYSPNYIASMLKLPQVVVPIGEVPYESRITNQTEKLPIVGSIAAAPGSDLMLLDIVESLLKTKGRPRSVATGRTMF
ncbi:putative amidase [Hypoxylon sp. EC38]|nr:putative amidase [Hypoxylon sp. EC38]